MNSLYYRFIVIFLFFHYAAAKGEKETKENVFVPFTYSHEIRLPQFQVLFGPNMWRDLGEVPLHIKLVVLFPKVASYNL